MVNVLVTTEFCRNAQKLKENNDAEGIHNLRSALIALANRWKVPKKFHDHQLSGNDFRELHVTGDVLLIYRYEPDKDTLVITLKLANLTNHKKLTKDSNRKNYEYHEVSTQDLHDITSSSLVKLSSWEQEYLNDILESISDYSSTYTNDGYIILDDYSVKDGVICAEYGYYLYKDDSLADSIDFEIPLDKYSISSLDKYVHAFSKEVADAFE